MNYLKITLATLVVFMLFLACACGGGGTGSGSTQQSDGQSAQTTEPEEPEEPIEPEIMDFSGDDPEELLETWENMGEDPEDVSFFLPESGGIYMPLVEWHITEIAEDTYDEYSIELTEGDYTLFGIGGAGIVDLDAVAYGEDGEELDIDELVDSYPMLMLWLDEDQEIKVTFDPVEFEEDAESALYCWFIYED